MRKVRQKSAERLHGRVKSCFHPQFALLISPGRTTSALGAGKPESRQTMANRWWTYQRERFPLLAHSPVIAAFSLSAVSYSALLRGTDHLPAWKPCAVAFLSSFLFFLQLRLADEFKDFDEDARYRPYRPVPRGLVSLRDLGWVWAGSIMIQLALALWLAPRLIVLLVLTWIYLGLMSKEFFARRWLKARPITYMVTHMAIMPLVDLYTTSCDWVPAGAARPPQGLLRFLVVSFFNGMVVEIGRKIRSPQDEEVGVETYSVLWGRRNAVIAWLAMVACTAGFAYVAAQRIGFAWPVLIILLVLFITDLGVAALFLHGAVPKRGGYVEAMSGIWSLLMYLSLGFIPMVLRQWGMA
jgi:4-hydroxybenzoate polyprenyltransferase